MRFPSLSTFVRTVSLLSLLSHASAEVKDSLEEIKALPTEKGVIQFNEEQFKKFVRKPRSYSIFVALTVSGMQCEPCAAANIVLERIGSHLPKGSAADKLFIASLPFEKARNIFNHYQLTSAPNLYFFPPIETALINPKFEPFKLSSGGFDIDHMTKFLTQQVGEKVSYDKPIPWALYGSIVSSIFVGGLGLYIAYQKFTTILYSVKTWSALSMVFLLTMLSGQMWNSIRGAGFAKYSKNGAIEWFAGGFQDQYGLESQIVAVAYGLATLVLIQLGTSAPKVKNPLFQSLFSTILISLFLLSIVFIVTLFKRKFPPYPYKIFFD